MSRRPVVDLAAVVARIEGGSLSLMALRSCNLASV